MTRIGRFEKAALFLILLCALGGLRALGQNSKSPEPAPAKPIPAPPAQERPQPTKPANGGKTLTLDLGNGVTMELVRIEAGEFLMGSPDSEAAHDLDEVLHKVKIGKPFYMGKYEVTQKQWQAVMGKNPARLKGDNLPVESVSWDDGQTFCRKLAAMTGRAVRLPTEAEWEYACRAGTTTAFCFGNTISTDQANYNGDPNLLGSGSPGALNRKKTMPVGSFPPNAWGLHDMHGNVWEWCQDWYHENYYKGRPNPDVDPAGAERGSDTPPHRVARGGSWSHGRRFVRSADRFGAPPDKPSQFVASLGLRVVAVETP